VEVKTVIPALTSDQLRSLHPAVRRLHEQQHTPTASAAPSG
jgi:hypothetical protein